MNVRTLQRNLREQIVKKITAILVSLLWNQQAQHPTLRSF